MDADESVLIVDDDESVCRTLALSLGEKGYQTDTAGTAREAIEKARRRSFNVALLDIRLPDMDGVALIPLLRDTQPDVAVVMIAGHPSPETTMQALNEGASAHVTKPLNMDELLVKIQSAIERQRLVIESRRPAQAAQRELAERRRAENGL